MFLSIATLCFALSSSPACSLAMCVPLLAGFSSCAKPVRRLCFPLTSFAKSRLAFFFASVVLSNSLLAFSFIARVCEMASIFSLTLSLVVPAIVENILLAKIPTTLANSIALSAKILNIGVEADAARSIRGSRTSFLRAAPSAVAELINSCCFEVTPPNILSYWRIVSLCTA